MGVGVGMGVCVRAPLMDSHMCKWPKSQLWVAMLWDIMFPQLSITGRENEEGSWSHREEKKTKTRDV